MELILIVPYKEKFIRKDKQQFFWVKTYVFWDTTTHTFNTVGFVPSFDVISGQRELLALHSWLNIYQTVVVF